MNFLKDLSSYIKRKIVNFIVSETETEDQPIDINDKDYGKFLRAELKIMLKLSLAVSICMLITVSSVLMLEFYHHTPEDKLAYLPFSEEGDLSSGVRFGQTLANALMVIGVITVMTFLLVLLIKYNCYRIISVWLMFTTGFVFSVLLGLYAFNLFQTFNVPIDYITSTFFIFNIMVVSLISVHWKAPMISQQISLQWLSAILALLLNKNLPDWTVWSVLAAAAIYDIFAVLCPFGPLKMLVNLVHDRKESLMVGLVYTSTMAWRDESSLNLIKNEQINEPDNESLDNTVDNSSDNAQTNLLSTNNESPANNLDEQSQNIDNQVATSNENRDEEQPAVIHLGLGDFIFYSVLMARATSSGDLNTVFSCLLFINIGLIGTLIVHSFAKKALPALPFSIAFGIVSYFTTHYLITPFYQNLVTNLIFI